MKRQDLNLLAKEIRKDILNMALAAGAQGAHLGGALSCVEILTALYGYQMRKKIENPYWEERDRLIFSKGHGALAYYSALAEVGYFDKNELASYKSNETFLYGHPSLNMERGIEFSSGSLGQGVSLGVGTALALRAKENHNSSVYVIVGDGECNEGSVWEALMSAAHFKLNRLTVIVDKNGLQYDGMTENVMNLGNLVEKFRSFGFYTNEIDGHNIGSLCESLGEISEKPKAIIANTVKGKGISFMEGNPKWHSSRLSQSQYDTAMKELG